MLTRTLSLPPAKDWNSLSGVISYPSTRLRSVSHPIPSLILALILTPSITQTLNLIPFQPTSHPSPHLQIYHQLQKQQSFPYSNPNTKCYPADPTASFISLSLKAWGKGPLTHITGKFQKCSTVNGFFLRLTKQVWLSVCPPVRLAALKWPWAQLRPGRECVL